MMKSDWSVLALSILFFNFGFWVHLNNADYVIWSQDKLFTDGKRFVEVVHDLPANNISTASRISTRCYVHEQRPSVVKTVLSVREDQLTYVLSKCEGGPLIPASRRKRGISLVYPGTKWCGLADSANGYDDLGRYAETDKCCRAHDKCPDYFSPFASKYGLINFSLSYRFSCSCDNEFYECLKDVKGETVSSTVGWIYFSLWSPKCYKRDHPLKCTRKGWWWTCRRRSPDTSKPKAWRFFSSESWT